MLQELSIRNFAIIDDLTVSFASGLTVLTGETGAGKSIIINAVNLILGRRATPKLIRTGADSAELEARFLVPPKSPVARLMDEQSLDPSEGLLIRRVIARRDSSRIYINGRQATNQLLARMTEHLASIAGQHAHQKLLKEDEHLMILDQFGGLMRLRRDLSECYRKMTPLAADLQRLEKQKMQAADQSELLVFQKREITDANPLPEEDATLENEQRRLKNAAGLIQTVHESLDGLYNAPGAAAEKLSTVSRSIETAARLDPALTEPGKQLAEIHYQLEDVIQMLQAYLSRGNLDESRLEQVEERLDILNKLKRKYGGSLSAVMQRRDEIDRDLNTLDTLDTEIGDIRQQLSGEHRQLVRLSMELSKKRAAAAKMLSKKIEAELASLSMPHVRFNILLEPMAAGADTPSHFTAEGNCVQETGIDQVSFMISPNTGEFLKPLASIASGGELSRVVLALKAILAEGDAVESIVFDEVDAGIGGGVAETVGKKLLDLARNHQVICITHLPQIAKFGLHHFKISKHVADGRTHTSITPVKDEERIQELARMLAGETITETTLNHARELLKT